MTHRKRRLIIIDTPNVVFHNWEQGGEQIRRNIFSLLKFIHYISVYTLVVITPKMIREYPDETEFITIGIQEKKGKIFFSNTNDPDEVILSLAERLDAPVMTNDKFRQKKYARFNRIKHRVIRFKIRDNQIIPRSQYWSKYMEEVKC